MDSRAVTERRVKSAKRTRPHAKGSAGESARRVSTWRRVAGIDAIRGVAICLMVVYHFLFDLNWFHVFRADFNNDPLWLGFRALVVSMFLLLVGVSLVLAARAGMSRRRFWRRIALVGICALLVSAASYVTFPKTFITFGILHCIVVTSILTWPLARHPWISLGLAIAVIVAGLTVHSPMFDAPWLNWVGFTTHKPPMEDYVPLFPWMGVSLVGIAVGNWLVAPAFKPLDPLSRAAPAWLTWLGRHSLIVYMVHQPVMVGLLRVIL
jgi:uncharacterized membrane protein